MRDRLQAAAKHFGEDRGVEQREGDQRAHQPVGLETRRNEQRKHHHGEEQHADQRQAAPQLDEGGARIADHRHFGAAAEREQQAERDRGRDRPCGDHDVEHDAAPVDGRDGFEARKASGQQRRRHDGQQAERRQSDKLASSRPPYRQQHESQSRLRRAPRPRRRASVRMSGRGRREAGRSAGG